MTGALQPPFVPLQWYPPDPPKSAVAAGVLQLFFGCSDWGRFYVGSLGIAFTQLALGILGIGTVSFIVGFFILVPLSIWTFVDAILMFSGSMKDKEGRKLR
jgi:TM2 domain-containing membrane protein YozV